MTTSIALVVRFYGCSLNEVLNWTLSQFSLMLEEMGNILKLESGTEDTPVSLTGKSAMTLGRQLFQRHKG